VPEVNIVTKDEASIGETSEDVVLDSDANIDGVDEINDTTDYEGDDYNDDGDNTVDDSNKDGEVIDTWEHDELLDINDETTDEADGENIADSRKAREDKDVNTWDLSQGEASISGIDSDASDDDIINDISSDSSDHNENLDENTIGVVNKDKDFAYESHDILFAARTNDIITLASILRHKPEWVSIRDENGWEALHEATCNSHIDAVQMLVETGDVDVNSRTGINKNGGSPLWWAIEVRSIPADSPIVVYLLANGAQVIPPDRDSDL